MTESNIQWFAKADWSKYKGEYVIISERQVLMHGHRLKQMVDTFRKKYPGKVPHVAKIAKEDFN